MPDTIDALFAFIFAGATVWTLVPATESLARGIGAMDVPNERSLHEIPTPKLGGVAVLVALTQVLGFGSQLTPPERYSRTHLWYLQGQEQNLRLWQELAVLATSGSISDAELGARFEREIVPFWSMADQRLKKESPSP